MCIRDRHYPHTLSIAKKITKQESDTKQSNIYIPELAYDLVEEINFAARKSEYVDFKSGVSARMSITAFENLVSTAKRRVLINGEDKTSVRLSDFTGIIPSINGKIELVYEGEEQGSDQISFNLISEGVKTIFLSFFPAVQYMQKRVPEEAPSHVLYRKCCTHFFDVAKKAAPERVGISISYTKRIQNTYRKRCIFVCTGSRREFTPGRLGAQNRWLLKGFLSEGSLHRTRGRDRPGAHFACC